MATKLKPVDQTVKHLSSVQSKKQSTLNIVIYIVWNTTVLFKKYSLGCKPTVRHYFYIKSFFFYENPCILTHTLLKARLF